MIKGFTLLELMLSIAVFTLLMTAAFSLIASTTDLMAEVSEAQSDSAVRMRFLESCRIAFEKMATDSEMEFDYVDRGDSRFDTYLSFVDAPGVFDFGFNFENQISRVVLSAEVQSDGFIRSGIYYFTETEWEKAKKRNFTNIEAPFLELISRMTQLSWRFYDQKERRWRNTLEENFQFSLVEITLKTENQIVPVRSVFWFLSR